MFVTNINRFTSDFIHFSNDTFNVRSEQEGCIISSEIWQFIGSFYQLTHLQITYPPFINKYETIKCAPDFGVDSTHRAANRVILELLRCNSQSAHTCATTPRRAAAKYLKSQHFYPPLVHCFLQAEPNLPQHHIFFILVPELSTKAHFLFQISLTYSNCWLSCKCCGGELST